MMKQKVLLLLASWLLPTASFHLSAQPTIDGLMNDADYLQVLTYTGGNNGFGDNNDLGALYFYADGTAMYLGIPGELESSSANNQIVVFFDFSGYGGIGTGVDFPGGGAPQLSNSLAGTNLPADVDYLLAGNRGSTAGQFFVDAVRYGNAPGILNSGFVHSVNISGSAAQVSTGATLGTRMDGNTASDLTTAYRSDFASNPLAGWEMRLPLDAFGGVGSTQTVRILVAIISESGIWSDETLPSASVSGNFGDFPNLTGGEVSFSPPYPLDGTLPVELIRFEATAQAGEILLDWETTLERQHSHFEVERSADGAAWQALDRVYPATESEAGQAYAYTDQQPLAGRNLYRLRQVDIDGQFAYSPVVQAWAQVALTAWPNPLQDQLHVRLVPQSAPAAFSLLDALGRVVWQQNIAPGTAEVTLDLMGLPAGTYFGRLRTATGTESLRLYKQ